MVKKRKNILSIPNQLKYQNTWLIRIQKKENQIVEDEEYKRQIKLRNK
jgi:hypothetical protein